MMRKYIEYVKESWTPELTMSYLVFGLASFKGKGLETGIAGFQPVKTCLILGTWSVLLAIIFFVASSVWRKDKGAAEFKGHTIRLTFQIVIIMGFCVLAAIIMAELVML